MKYFELLKEIYETGETVGPRGLETRELRNVVLDVDTYNAVSVPVCRDWQDVRKYLYAELAWYMSGDRKLDKIRPFSKFWDKIANPDGTINSNYGDLVFYRKNSLGMTSFNWALISLLSDQDTRQAIILYNDRELFYKGNKDLICNQYQQFFIRNNVLDCTVTLRSSDAIYGLTFNIPWWSFVHQRMYLMLKKSEYPELQLGKITAFIGSSHIYQNKYELVKEMLNGEKEYRWLSLIVAPPIGESFEFYDYFFKRNFIES